METEIFDRETILDLMVNFIPLGIILFFFGVYSIYTPWGFDLLPSGQMFGIMGIMFVALLILTYISAKAIAGDEKRAAVYPQGQAGLDGAKTVDEIEHEIEAEEAGEAPETAAAEADETATDAAAESTKPE
jgi:hypothetical protein